MFLSRSRRNGIAHTKCLRCLDHCAYGIVHSPGNVWRIASYQFHAHEPVSTCQVSALDLSGIFSHGRSFRHELPLSGGAGHDLSSGWWKRATSRAPWPLRATSCVQAASEATLVAESLFAFQNHCATSNLQPPTSPWIPSRGTSTTWWTSWPLLQSAMATSSAGKTELDTQSLRDSFIPIFDGTTSGYREWRKRIVIYAKKMELSKRTQEAVLNLLGSLQGTAWRIVEDFDLNKVNDPDAFEGILKQFDAAFQSVWQQSWDACRLHDLLWLLRPKTRSVTSPICDWTRWKAETPGTAQGGPPSWSARMVPAQPCQP